MAYLDLYGLVALTWIHDQPTLSDWEEGITVSSQPLFVQMSRNRFEDYIARLNADVFFREFSFPGTVFESEPGNTKEFADYIVWINDLLLIYQLKERDPCSEGGEEAEEIWFENKITKEAKKQVSDTWKYLQGLSGIPLQNHRGKTFKLSKENINRIIKIILYVPSARLPSKCRKMRFYRSKISGFIHILHHYCPVKLSRKLIWPAAGLTFLSVSVVRDNKSINAIRSNRAA